MYKYIILVATFITSACVTSGSRVEQNEPVANNLQVAVNKTDEAGQTSGSSNYSWYIATRSGCEILSPEKIEGVEVKQVTWSGNCKNNKGTGQGTISWRNEEGKVFARYEGELETGKRSGKGKYWVTRKDGKKIRAGGEFFDGLQVSGWIEYPTNLRYEGEIKNAKPHGEGKMYAMPGHPHHGQILTATFENGIAQRGVMLYADGTEYTGELKNLKPHGRGVLRDRSGKIMKGPGDFVENVYIGDGTKKTPEEPPSLAAEKIDRACAYSIPVSFEFLLSTTTTRWDGRCFDGYAQGEGDLIIASKDKSANDFTFSLGGFMVDGKFIRYKWEMSNYHKNEKVEKILDKVVDLFEKEKRNFRVVSRISELTKVDLLFLERYHKSSFVIVRASNGEVCKLYTGGLFGNFYGERKYPYGNPAKWLNTNTPQAGLLGFSIEGRVDGWGGGCKNGYAEGGGVLTTAGPGFINKFDIESVSNGEISGRMSLLGNNSHYKIYFLKSLWLRDYSEFDSLGRHVAKSFSLPQVASGYSIDEKSLKVIRDGFNKPIASDESAAVTEAALKKVFNMSFKLTGRDASANRWSSSFAGLSMAGVENSAEYFINWNITPGKIGLLPQNIQEIVISLDVSVVVSTKTKGMGIASLFMGSDKPHHKTVNIALRRADGFSNTGRERLFDVQTYLSTGSDDGLQIQATSIAPHVKLLAVNAK